MTIGEKLRNARGKTPRKKVVEATGVSESGLVSLENDRRKPNFVTIIRLANFYEKPVEFFVPTGNDLKELINSVKA